MKSIDEAVKVYRRQGGTYLLNAAIEQIYEPIRSRLPRTITYYNGIRVRASRVGDESVPWRAGHPNPEEYEQSLLEGIRNHAQSGDDIVIVGGGWGVSAVVAAQEVGTTGSVKVYEGAKQWASRIRETARLNGFSERIEVLHAVVGEAVQLRDNPGFAQKIEPSELPSSDIVVLDCEGAEIEILTHLVNTPKIAIVESHGFLGSTTEEVQQELKNLGYQNISSDIAEAGQLEEYCERNDILVNVATL